MAVSINKWNAAIALFRTRRYVAFIKKMILNYSSLKSLTNFLFFFRTIIYLCLVQHSDIEINPGPRKK